MYQHKTLRINYTSYDVRRQQDVINPSTPSRFIFLPSETSNSDFEHANSNHHPFLYAKVLGIYHAEVSYRNCAPRRMDFIHVRWLYYDHDHPGGWDAFRLDRVGYEPCDTEEDNLDSFDFVDPNDVVRMAHMIPDFRSGPTNDFLLTSHSVAHDHREHGTDWKYYYVNRFVDRDILMRYLGGGIGHYRHKVTRSNKDDTPDEEQLVNTSVEDDNIELEDENEQENDILDEADELQANTGINEEFWDEDEDGGEYEDEYEDEYDLEGSSSDGASSAGGVDDIIYDY
ncbi:unnamed protein product [Rhizoctonia solani]|uniref:Uncharacterized protein n=1 Tax=Rhizoctonia solani TaxID=456999 RepID=A0A8H3DLY2_9AGAM|nr:unnamed protein product [Rhizoctonia solani]